MRGPKLWKAYQVIIGGFLTFLGSMVMLSCSLLWVLLTAIR